MQFNRSGVRPVDRLANADAKTKRITGFCGARPRKCQHIDGVQVATLGMIGSTYARDQRAHLAGACPGLVKVFHPVIGHQNYARCYDNAGRSVDGPRQIVGGSTNVNAASGNLERENGSAGSP